MQYKVSYKVDNSYSTRVMGLQYGSEGEAKEKLYAQSTVPRNKEIIILGIIPDWVIIRIEARAGFRFVPSPAPAARSGRHICWHGGNK